MIKKVLSLLLTLLLLLVASGCDKVVDSEEEPDVAVDNSMDAPVDSSQGEPGPEEEPSEAEASQEEPAQSQAQSQSSSQAESQPQSQAQNQSQAQAQSQPESSEQIERALDPFPVQGDDPPYDPQAGAGEESGSQSEVEQQQPQGAALQLLTQMAETEFPSYSVASESIKVIITNTSQVEGGYGLAYRIDRLEDGEWKAVPLEFDIIAIAAILMPGQSYTEIINLHQEQYVYSPGQYRVVFTDTPVDMVAEFILE